MEGPVAVTAAEKEKEEEEEHSHFDYDLYCSVVRTRYDNDSWADTKQSVVLFIGRGEGLHECVSNWRTAVTVGGDRLQELHLDPEIRGNRRQVVEHCSKAKMLTFVISERIKDVPTSLRREVDHVNITAGYPKEDLQKVYNQFVMDHELVPFESFWKCYQCTSAADMSYMTIGTTPSDIAILEICRKDHPERFGDCHYTEMKSIIDGYLPEETNTGEEVLSDADK